MARAHLREAAVRLDEVRGQSRGTLLVEHVGVDVDRDRGRRPTRRNPVRMRDRADRPSPARVSRTPGTSRGMSWSPTFRRHAWRWRRASTIPRRGPWRSSPGTRWGRSRPRTDASGSRSVGRRRTRRSRDRSRVARRAGRRRRRRSDPAARPVSVCASPTVCVALGRSCPVAASIAYVTTESPCSTCRKPALTGPGEGAGTVGVGPGVVGADGLLPPHAASEAASQNGWAEDPPRPPPPTAPRCFRHAR